MRPPRRSVAAGVAENGPLVLFGGVYDWYDPGLLLDAWPAIRARYEDARLLFFENPNPASTPQGAFERARRRAREMDPGGTSIVFSPWLPYGSRPDLYAAVVDDDDRCFGSGHADEDYWKSRFQRDGAAGSVPRPGSTRASRSHAASGAATAFQVRDAAKTRAAAEARASTTGSASHPETRAASASGPRSHSSAAPAAASSPASVPPPIVTEGTPPQAASRSRVR